jgi:hypothetical protein
MSKSYAQRDSEVAAGNAALQQDRGALLGYGPDSMQPGRLQYRPYAEPVQAGPGMAPTPVYESDLPAILGQLSTEDQGLLAIDMYLVGVYENLNYMFDDNGEIDQQFFTKAVGDTVNLAYQSEQLGLKTEFLDVLLRNTDRPELLSTLLAEKKAELRSGSGSGGGGSVINYIDPFALADAAKKASASVTGRMATPAEQQAFVKMVHGLQASGVSSISVPARAEAFARQQAPNEAAAMDYANAAGALMQVLGIGGR